MYLVLNSHNTYHCAASQPSPWKLIRSNMFQHRSRKTQTIDEVNACSKVLFYQILCYESVIFIQLSIGLGVV